VSLEKSKLADLLAKANTLQEQGASCRASTACLMQGIEALHPDVLHPAGCDVSANCAICATM